jgi:hypothetical protein
MQILHYKLNLGGFKMDELKINKAFLITDYPEGNIKENIKSKEIAIITAENEVIAKDLFIANVGIYKEFFIEEVYYCGLSARFFRDENGYFLDDFGNYRENFTDEYIQDTFRKNIYNFFDNEKYYKIYLDYFDNNEQYTNEKYEILEKYKNLFPKDMLIKIYNSLYLDDLFCISLNEIPLIKQESK